MNKILAKANLAIRSSVSTTGAEPCSGYLRNGFLHISIESNGCKYRNAGYCTVCDYGCGKPASVADVTHYMEKVWSENCGPVFEVLIGSCGSVFDEGEISDGVLDAIFRFLIAHPVPSVIFETHYTTVTTDVLTRVKNALVGTIGEIAIEMGLESSDPFVLENCINKYMDLSVLCEKMALIRSFGFSTVLNVFLGVPFLTPALQLADAEHTIRWACDKGVDGVVVFPANIKRGTLVEYLYKKGRYARPSAWLLVELLNRIPQEIAGKIELSWYGDRQKQGMAKNAIPPYACEKCDDMLQEFFAAYNAKRSDAYARRGLIDELLSKSNVCGCFSKTKAALECSGNTAEDLVSREIKMLRQEFNLIEEV